jgi:hypothetical protein
MNYLPVKVMLDHKGEFLDINIVYKYQHQFISKHIYDL